MDSMDDGSVAIVASPEDRPKTPATYNRKDPAEIPILKSLPDVGGSSDSDSSSMTVVSPEDRPKEQDYNTYINGCSTIKT